MREQLTTALKRMGDSDEAYFSYGGVVWDALTSGERDVLKQLLFQGPVYDGHIISKSSRDSLIGHGLAVRCCFLGEQGYTAATYLAFSVHKQGKGEKLVKRPGTHC